MKKLLSVLLAVVLLLSVCSVAVFAAESELTLSTTVSKANVNRGDIIEVKVSLDKNAGLRNLAFEIDYDPNVLEICCYAEYSEHNSPADCAADPDTCIADVNKIALADSNNPNYGSDLGACSQFRTNAPYVVQWCYGTSKKTITYTGEVFTAKFRVKDTAAFAKSDIDVVLSEENCDKFIDKNTTTKFVNPVATGTSITVVCPHANGTTQAYDPDQHWQKCNDCGQPVGAKEDHKGGTATCTAEAVCTECHQKYGTTKAHSYTVTNKNDTHHWKECSVCQKEEPDSRVTHTYNQQVINSKYENTPADCKNDATYFVSCLCGAKGTETFVAKDTATGDHQDKDGKWETDADYHWHTCKCGTVIDNEKHHGGTATCTAQAVCADCQEKYGTTKDHSYTVTDKDSTHHWKECSVCGGKQEGSEVKHTYDRKVKNDDTRVSYASCSEDAVYKYSCTCGAVGTETFKDEGSATGDHIDKDGGTWKSDGTNHWHECGCGQKFIDKNTLGTEKCSGGTANCKEAATCTVCKNKHGAKNPNNHVGGTNIQNAKPAKCWEDGYTGDTHCNSCNVKIKNGDPISKSTVKHTPGEWKTNPENTGHYRNCTVAQCGIKLDEKDHEGGTATCKDLKKCTVCAKEYGDKDKNNHVGGTNIQNAKPAKCWEDGYTGDTHCNSCNVKIKDGDPISKSTVAHTPGEWKTNPENTGHYRNCTVAQCGIKLDEKDHEGGTATCKDLKKCTVCAKEYGDKDKNNHAGGTELKDYKEPKCNEEGFTGNTHCKGCNEILTPGTAIAKVPHIVTQWSETKPATTEEKGEKTGSCMICTTALTVETAKLVAEVKTENITGNATIENIDSTNISEDTYFSAADVTTTVDPDLKKAIENAIKEVAELQGKDIAAMINVDLLLKETANNGDKIADVSLVLDGKARVAVPVDSDMLSKYTDLELVFFNAEGEAQLIPYTIENGLVTFEASEFNYFTFVGKKVVVEEEEDKEDKEPSTSPVTGDSMTALAFIIVALAVSAAALVVTRKKTEA